MKHIIAQPASAVADYVAARLGLPRNSWHDFNVLGLIAGDYLVAGVVYSHWSPSDVMVTIAADETARWATPEYLFAIHDFPFNQIKVRRLNAVVRQSNKRSQQFVEHLGFKAEGLIREAYEEEDGVLYGMLKRECRWIGEEFKRSLQRRHLRRLSISELAAA